MLTLAFGAGAPGRSAHAQPVPCKYSISATIVAPPGPLTSSPTYGNAISPNGRYVVGTYNPSGFGNDRAFWFDVQTQQFTPLPSLPGTIASRAYDVSDAGLVVGTIAIPADKGFIFSIASGQYTLLEPIHPQGVCEVTGITSKGVVCGTRSIGSKTDPVFPKTAFIWTAADGFTDLGVVSGWSTFAVDIAEDGVAAVSVGFGLESHRWDGISLASVGTVVGAGGMTPNAIAETGHLVGAASFNQGGQFWAQAFEFRDGALRGLPVLNRDYRSCTAIAVNSSGLVAGGCRSTSGQWMPSAWVSGQIIDLRQRFPTVANLSYEAVAAVADSGTLVCRGMSNGSVVAFVLQPLPATPGDTNCDERIDIDDLMLVIVDWGKRDSFADVNHDGIVNVDDLILVINHWTFA
jgi:uncharacterized membrane protein